MVNRLFYQALIAAGCSVVTDSGLILGKDGSKFLVRSAPNSLTSRSKPLVEQTPADAEILISSHCNHCPRVLSDLTDLLKLGKIGTLKAINVEHHPEAAASRAVRSVPWIKIGPFILEGQYRTVELQQWAERAASNEGMAAYFDELLQNQQLARALSLVRAEPQWLDTLIDMATDVQTPMATRIGIGAIFEDLAETDILHQGLKQFLQMIQSEHPQTRADGAYYIGLLGPKFAKAHLSELLHDPDHEVREIVQEAIES